MPCRLSGVPYNRLSYEIFSQPLLKFVLPDESSMKIYTRTGDTGSTGLFGGPRVAKDDDRIEAYGTVDELNAAIGTARSADLGDVVDSQLEKTQHALFAIGAELATPEPDDHSMRIISSAHISQLEQWIDEHEGGLEPLQQFILPAGDAGATHLHLARAICRRAERRVVTLVRRHETSISEELIIYLNRLSDLLFVLTRSVNQLRGVEDVQWVKPDGQSQRS
ncbi:MAG: cob(I)yrinic acid a,c-diamide adenosyltransferase [Rubripirellula sp.]